MNLYAFIFAAVVAATVLAGTAYKAYQFGADKIRVEWDKANLEAQAKVEADRQSQEGKAKRTAQILQAKIATQELVNRQIKSDLDRELKKNPLPDICVIPDSLRDIANNALSGPKSDAPGGVPKASPTPPITR